MWPASALLTGNGVAFILRVPGTRARRLVEHARRVDLRRNGRGRAPVEARDPLPRPPHLQPIELRSRALLPALGKLRAEPLDFWWGPMSLWLALALASSSSADSRSSRGCACSGSRSGFWLTFAAGIGVLAASGHSMTARWHVGPISGWDFWWLLVTSPEILVFLFFMITDPKTIPTAGRGVSATQWASGCSRRS